MAFHPASSNLSHSDQRRSYASTCNSCTRGRDTGDSAALAPLVPLLNPRECHPIPVTSQHSRPRPTREVPASPPDHNTPRIDLLVLSRFSSIPKMLVQDIASSTTTLTPARRLPPRGAPRSSWIPRPVSARPPRPCRAYRDAGRGAKPTQGFGRM